MMLIVGLDWSHGNHAYLLMNGQGHILERGTVAHSGDGLSELAHRIRQWADGPGAVRVGVETHDGALLDWLLEQRYTVFAIQPKSAQRARDMFRPSGSKDDRIDARVLAEYVRLPEGFVADERQDLDRLAAAAQSGRLHLSFVEIRVEHPGAVALMNEGEPSGGGALDPNPLYLVHVNRRWRVVPGMTEHQPASVLVEKDAYTVFDSLEAWYRSRKEALLRGEQ